MQTRNQINRVYKNKTGKEYFDLAMDEGEHKTGFLQVSETERVKVVRKRGGHTWCYWERVDGEVEPMSHPKDGALF